MAATKEPATGSGLQPAREQRILPLEDVEWRKSGAGDGQLTVRGHAAVFNRLSLDLGGFRERIAPDAFTAALDRNPDVHALWDHDTKYVLARTKNKTLDLREDPQGLHFWAKVADTSYAKDLRLLMERGDVDQASFAFTVARDEWTTDDHENVTRTILEVGELYDVTITAQGAYPQTDAAVVAHMRSRIKTEIAEGRLPDAAAAVLPETTVAPADPADEPETPDDDIEEVADDVAAEVSDEQRTTAPDDPADGDSTHEDEVVEEGRVSANERELIHAEMAAAIDAEKKRKREFELRKYSLSTKGK
jgi:HK97 family phage prohead protease